MKRETNKNYKTDKYYLNCNPECKEKCEFCKKLISAISRLAEIEDILGEEYDIDRIREAILRQSEYKQFMEKWMYVAGLVGVARKIGIERTANLVDADKDGRCFISPVKIGQTVWFIRDPKQHPESIVETTVEKIIQKYSGMYIKLGCNSTYETSCKSIGKTVFLTYEDAKCLSRSEQND